MYIYIGRALNSFNWITYIENPFTNTLWNGIAKKELIINIDKKFIWINSYQDFIKKWQNKQWKLNWKTTRFNNFLINLKEQLNQEYDNQIDPVKYLYYLYYTEKLSTYDIYDRFHHLWWYSNKRRDTFNFNFKNILKWELRESSEQTEISVKKIKAKEKQNEEKEKSIDNLTSDLLKEKQASNDVSDEVLNTKKTAQEKIEYILIKKWYIKEWCYKKTILALAKKYKTRVTALAIQKILNHEWFWNINMHPWKISDMKKNNCKL